MLLCALDHTLSLAQCNTCSQTQSAIQVQGCGLSLKILVPEDPFGGMPTITSKSLDFIYSPALWTVKTGSLFIFDNYSKRLGSGVMLYLLYFGVNCLQLALKLKHSELKFRCDITPQVTHFTAAST